MRRYAIVLVLLAGCDFYFGGGDDEPPPPCEGDYGAVAPQELRNPQTGQCESVGWGGCQDFCGPCPLDVAADPDWGQCYSACEQLDEQSCLSTDGCFAAYDEDARWLDAPSKIGFKGCWQTAPSGPVQGGGCWELDAHACSRHDDCSAFYTPEYGPNDALIGSTFSRCAPEPTDGGCSLVDCGPGYHCDEQCYPCDGVDGPCDEPYCVPVCTPDEPNSCLAVTCGPGTTCVEVCDTMGPTPANLTPPAHCQATCVPDPAACETLTTEPACSARGDCTPVYDGENCTCYPGSCTCEVLTYARCETWGMPTPL